MAKGKSLQRIQPEFLFLQGGYIRCLYCRRYQRKTTPLLYLYGAKQNDKSSTQGGETGAEAARSIPSPCANESKALAVLPEAPCSEAGFCNLPPPTCLSSQRYTSEWHRLSHSGLRRCVRVCARTSKLHSTHLLIVLKGEKEKDRHT